MLLPVAALIGVVGTSAIGAVLMLRRLRARRLERQAQMLRTLHTS